MVCACSLFAAVFAFFAAAASPAETVESVLSKPHLLVGEEREGVRLRLQFYHEAYMRIVEADRAADEAWLELGSPSEIKERQRDLSSRMVEMIGGFPERTPLNPRTTGVVRKDGYRVEKVVFESRPNFFVTGHVYVPEDPSLKPPYPAVLVPCGHSLAGKNAPCYGYAGASGVKRGMVTFVYDPIDQGERHQRNLELDEWGTGVEHNRVGWRCQILGWGAAQLHIWDGMRAIDYLASRPDVDADRIGVTGVSGGGTLTSYIMALDPRIKAGCPSGYITTLRDLCTFRGPQDHEQNVQGMLSFGLNQLGYVLMRAPQPELLGFTHDDFFPIIGSMETLSRGREVYSCLDADGLLEGISADGPHNWSPSIVAAQYEWLRQVLNGDRPDAPDAARYRKLDYGFNYGASDCGLAFDATNRLVCAEGRVLRLPGARSVYDILRDEADRQERLRKPLTREIVREVTGVKRLSELPFEVLDKRSFDLTGGVKAVKATLYRGDSTLCVPVVTFTPPNPTGIPVLYLAYSRDRKDLAGRVEKFLAAGAEVTVADLRASGETWKGYHTFCGAGWDGEEELSMMYTWLGENLVAHRTEDALVAASYAAASSRFRSVIAVASGVMAVPAAHAFYLERQLFYSIKFEDPCASWRKVIDDPQQDFRYAAAVYGAFKHYDWPDLVEAAHPECVPELMRMADGRPVETREMWEKERRPELLKIFTERMYGVRPEEKPRSLKFEPLSPDRSILGGAGVSRKVRATYEGTKGTNSFDFTLYLPSSASAKAPVPAFVMICLRKETAELDPESDVELREQWPVAEILRRGYATAGFYKDQLSPDMDHANLLGVFSVYEEMKPYRSNSRWGTLSAWAWGASRVMDYLETVPEIDSGHVAVVGHSRGGKTALLTGVTDTRFAMACSNDSGCGGAKLNHMRLGNSEHFSQIVRTFPYWFCPDFTLCVNRDDQIDFDQHEFIALIAPRLVCVASASEDAWAGPRGEFESARLASPAWKLYGLEGLGDDAAFPAPGGRVMKGCIEYHLREGKHRITDYDWGRYMDFADFHGWRKR